MKYIFVTLQINHGEREFSSMGVHAIEDDDVDMNVWADHLAKMEYANVAEDEDEEDEVGQPGFRPGSYFFDGGEIAVRVSGVREIPKIHYDILSQYI